MLLLLMDNWIGGRDLDRQIVGLGTGEAKISDFGRKNGVEEDVTGLDVAVDDRWIARHVEEEEATCNIDRDGKSARPGHELGAAAVEQRILEATIGHELIDKESGTTPVGGEAEKGDDAIAAVDLRGQRKLVVELAIALERARVHDLDSQRQAGAGKLGTVDGAESSLAELAGRREGAGGAAQSRVGEAARLV